MNLRIEFTEPECEKLRNLCIFTKDERLIFDLRVSDHSIVEVSQKLKMSEATVNRRIKNIKRKILKVL